MKVENSSQWAANTISFVGVDTLYLRMAAEGAVIWYEVGDAVSLTWVVDTESLNKAWVNRNAHEDLQ